MSSLTVVYGARRFKVPVKPSTTLAQVRDTVCASEELSLPTAEYGLARNGKQLDLTLPIRFANLVNNAQVDLIKVNQAKASSQSIRVKIRVPGGSDFVGTFPGNTQVSSVLANAGLVGTAKLANAPVSPESELSTLGGAGGLLLVLDPASSKKRPAEGAPAAPRGAESRSQETSLSRGQNPTTSGASTHQRDVSVYTAAKNPAFDDDPPEMDTRQFLTYYQQIKAQAEPAMISKETKERLRREQKPAAPGTTIRVKLPDQSLLEGKFATSEPGTELYRFVASYLRDPQRDFELLNVKPNFTIDKSGRPLQGYDLGGRALLLFRWKDGANNSEEPILSEKALSMVKQPAQSSASAAAISKKPAAQQKPGQDDTKPSSKTKNVLKGVPKWMKLHK